MEFFNRVDELRALESHWSVARGGRFFIVWGRRRVGKTELLAHFTDGKRVLFFEATDTTERSQLRALSEELARASANELLSEQPVTTWRGALTAIAQFCSAGERTVVVFDEFQYLAAQQPELATLLNIWWRKTGRNLPLVLIVSGSQVSFFRDVVLAGQMYGRRDGQLQLLPFDYKSAALFTPNYSPEDKIRTYAICGGMPYYLVRFDDKVSLRENILNNILYRDGFLHEEADLLLRQELTDPRRYFAVLDAIAAGATRNSAIANRAGLDTAQTYQALDILESLGLVEQLRPATASARSKKTAYAIKDGFLNFYFRFVEPDKSQFRTDHAAEQYLDQVVMPQLDHFVSKPTWERLCQDWIKKELNVPIVKAWWGKVRVAEKQSVDREIDAVAIDAKNQVVALGSCKWTSAPMDYNEELSLQQAESFIPGAQSVRSHYFFSRSGFTPQLKKLAKTDPDRYRLVTPRDLYK